VATGLRKVVEKADFMAKLIIAKSIVVSRCMYTSEVEGNCQGNLKNVLQLQ
jgi:hypothetical protein